MADARELVEMAEALGEPRPDPRLPLFEAIRVALDHMVEHGVNPACIADLLTLVASGYGNRLRNEVQGALIVGGGWVPPEGECSSDPVAFELLTQRTSALFREVIELEPVRLEVFALRATSDVTREQLRKAVQRGLRTLYSEPEERPPARRFPTPQEVLERMRNPGPVEDLLPNADEALGSSGVAVRTGPGTARPSTVEELRDQLARLREATQAVAEPVGWAYRSVEEVQRAWRELQLTGRAVIGIDRGTPEVPSVFRGAVDADGQVWNLDAADLARELAAVQRPPGRVNRSFTGRISEMHWNPRALERALGIEQPAPAASTTEPAEPRNRAERRGACPTCQRPRCTWHGTGECSVGEVAPRYRRRRGGL